MTFSGLRSRWTIPCAWAAARPRRIPFATRTTSATGRGWRGPKRSRSDVPEMSSMAMYKLVPASPISYTVATFGWTIDAAARPSRRKRERRSGSLSRRVGRTPEMATVRPELLVAGAVDDAHPAAAKFLTHDEATEAGLQCEVGARRRAGVDACRFAEEGVARAVFRILLAAVARFCQRPPPRRRPYRVVRRESLVGCGRWGGVVRERWCWARSASPRGSSRAGRSWGSRTSQWGAVGSTRRSPQTQAAAMSTPPGGRMRKCAAFVTVLRHGASSLRDHRGMFPGERPPHDALALRLQQLYFLVRPYLVLQHRHGLRGCHPLLRGLDPGRPRSAPTTNTPGYCQTEGARSIARRAS